MFSFQKQSNMYLVIFAEVMRDSDECIKVLKISSINFYYDGNLDFHVSTRDTETFLIKNSFAKKLNGFS